jgi:hypothetical protein
MQDLMRDLSFDAGFDAENDKNEDKADRHQRGVRQTDKQAPCGKCIRLTGISVRETDKQGASID